ncbi:MAG: hypothetical protein ACXWVM_30330 [Polyangiales bacterium]
MHHMRAMSLLARIIDSIVAWFRPARRPPALQSLASVLPLATATVEADRDVHHDVSLSESELFDEEREAAAPNESGVHLRALRGGNETRRVPALATRISPFDAPTVRVDLDDFARATANSNKR